MGRRRLGHAVRCATASSVPIYAHTQFKLFGLFFDSDRPAYTVGNTYTVHGESLESPGLCSLDGLVPARLPCTYKVRSELLLRRERCHHHTVRVCDAALLVRFDPVWCTFASSVHQAASTRPVRERWRGHVECSVSTFYSVYHEQDTFISIRATTARSYHHSLTDVTRDAHSTVSELSTRQTKRASKRKGTARKFTTRKHQSRPGSPAAAQGVARGPVAGRQW